MAYRSHEDYPYHWRTSSGQDVGGSTSRKRARSAAARLCRKSGEIVLFDERDKCWRLEPVAGRALWVADGNGVATQTEEPAHAR